METEIKNTADLVKIDDTYYKDKNNIYCYFKKIQDVDPATFEIIKSPHHPYSRDKNNVYYYEHTITGANPETFVILDEGYGYAKDSKSIYYGTKSLKEADLNTFKVINMNTAKDKNNVYRDGEISGENPSKF